MKLIPEEGISMQKRIFPIYLHCPGRFCELLASNLEEAEFIVEDLISQVLKRLPSIAIVSKTEIDFLPSYNIFTILIRISYYERVEEPPEDHEVIKLRVESLISQALLQLFWEIYLDDSPC